MELIGAYKILVWHNNKPASTWTYMGSKGENHKLIRKCVRYYKRLGVTGYDEYAEGILWHLNGSRYSTEEIERMLKLKAFI